MPTHLHISACCPSDRPASAGRCQRSPTCRCFNNQHTVNDPHRCPTWPSLSVSSMNFAVPVACAVPRARADQCCQPRIFTHMRSSTVQHWMLLDWSSGIGPCLRYYPLPVGAFGSLSTLGFCLTLLASYRHISAYHNATACWLSPLQSGSCGC